MSTGGSRRGRIAVVGAINVDLVVCASHLPAPGDTVVGPEVTRHGGGKGANAAVAAARAGGSVVFLGAVGCDPAAQEAERELRDEGIDCTGLTRLADHPTGMALIVVDPAGENQIAVGAGANAWLDARRVSAEIARRAGALDSVLVSTEIPGETVVAAVSAAAAAGTTCVLNPAPPIDAVLRTFVHRPILTPNRGELGALLALHAGRTGAARPPGPVATGDAHEVAEGAHALGAVTGAPVIVTLGSDGVMIVADGVVRRIPAPAVEVRDATGAGDTFNGVLAASLAAGDDLDAAAHRARTAASLSVGALGARAGMPDASRIARGAESAPRPAPAQER